MSVHNIFLPDNFKMGRTKFDFCFAIPSTAKCFIMEHKSTSLTLAIFDD